MATTAELITQLYVGYYNRAPDPEGLNYWIGRVNAGVSLADIADSFAASPEAIATYPYLALPNVVSPTTFITQIYQNLFNRAPDADGLAYYTNQLQTGVVTPGQMIAAIQANANTNPNNTDGTILANKVAVGLDWVQTAAATPGFAYDAAAASSANTILDNVTADAASVTAAQAQTDAFFGTGGGGAGDTFTLTNVIDNLVGGNANDTFIGDANSASAADQVNGGGGIDTLKLYGSVTIPNTTAVEVIDVYGVSTGSADVSARADVTDLKFNNTTLTGALTATVSATQKVSATNVVGAGGQSLNIAGGATAALALNNVGVGTALAVDLTAAATTTLNVESAGKASTITLANTGAGLKTLNVSGSADLSAGAIVGATAINITNTAKTTLSSAVDKVAVTGAAGAETISLTHATATAREFSVKTGAGDDRVVISNLAVTADLTDDKVVVSGGEGNDTLAIRSDLSTALGALSAAAFAKKGIANDFETLEITTQGAANDTVNLAILGSAITKVDFAAGLGDAQSVSGLASGGTVVLGAAASAGTDALTVNVKDAAVAGNNSDVLNITLDGAHAGAGLDYGVVAAAAVETINVNSTSTKTTALVAADTNTVDLTIANATTLKISGNVFLDLSGAALTGTALATIDASANTAGVNVSVNGATQGILITGTAKNDTFVGGSGADKIVAGAGDDIITGGAANDVIDITGGGSNTIKFGTSAATNGTDSISGFNVGAVATGGDVLDVAGQLTGITAATISANLTNLTGAQAVADDSIYTVNFGAAINGKNFAAADFADLFAAAGKTFSTTTAGAAQSVIVVQGTDETHVYYVDSAAGVATTIEAGEVGLVGVLSGVTNANTFINANFA